MGSTRGGRPVQPDAEPGVTSRQTKSTEPPLRDYLPQIQRTFGPSWKWSEIALWIEARQCAKERLPDFMIVWAYDFLRVWKQQQAMLREAHRAMTRDEQPKRKRRAD